MLNQRRISVLLIILVSAFLSVPAVSSRSSELPWSVSSPDQTLTLAVSAFEGSLTYTVTHHTAAGGIQVVHTSALGIVRQDQRFTDNLTFESAEAPVVINERYTMLTGKQRELVNHAHELTLNFRNDRDARLQIILRAYDDAVAFRYRFPEADATPHTVTQELTTFALPPEGRFWGQVYDRPTQYTPAYESAYVNGLAVGVKARLDGGAGWSFPALFNAAGQWVMLTEAGLDGSYFGAHLGPEPKNGVYQLVMPLAAEAMGIGSVEPTSTLPWATPWRVIMVGDSVGTIFDSNIVSHLSTPSRISDTAWIRPGRVTWSWWSDHNSSRNYASLKTFVDFAAEIGWEYSLVDANWNMMQGGTLDQLAAYAQTKGVGLLVWYNSGGWHNIVTEQPRDLMDDRDLRRAEFARLQALGVKGVKVDFFQSDKPGIIQLYLDILQDAADFQLLVDFHGCTLPRGWARTWPNLMTMEAVRGAEQYTFNETYARIAPSHNTILAFTRNVVGSMDYTPVTFTDSLLPHLTTNAHELALSVVFESGLQHFADTPSAYRVQPQAVLDFLRRVPVTWDTSRYLAGEPGQSVVLARAKGHEWYIAGINGQEEAQPVTLDLSFLPADTYTMTFIHDGDERTTFTVNKGTVDRSAPFKVTLAAYGGFVLHLTPA